MIFECHLCDNTVNTETSKHRGNVGFRLACFCDDCIDKILLKAVEIDASKPLPEGER